MIKDDSKIMSWFQFYKIKKKNTITKIFERFFTLLLPSTFYFNYSLEQREETVLYIFIEYIREDKLKNG